SFSGTVAQVNDPGADPANLTATIQWGDGAVNNGVAVTTDSKGNLIVQGTHTYANAGNFGLTVFVQDNTTGSHAAGSSIADVEPSVPRVTLHVIGVPVRAKPGQSFTSLIAVLHAPGASLSDLSVTINWGDGTTDSNAQVVPFGTDGSFEIVGTHDYAIGGQYTIGITVTATSSGAQGSASTTAFVEPLTPP